MRYNGPMAPRETAREGLTVAVTGPTGEIGQAFVAALERSREVGSILGMARRPFDPYAQGWKKVSYRRGDVLDRRGPRRARARGRRGRAPGVHDHGRREGEPARSTSVGSRNVFEASVAAGVKRLVYASSVAAYGFHRDNPQPLTEDVPARGTSDHYYSAQKAEVEELLADTLARRDTAGLRVSPCIVAGPQAPLLIDSLPYTPDLRAAAGTGPQPARRSADPASRCCPIRACRSSSSTTTMSPRRCARACSGGASRAYTTSPAPGELTVEAARRGARLVLDSRARAGGGRGRGDGRAPRLPARAGAMDRGVPRAGDHETEKARRELRWRPRHDALTTLRETISAAGWIASSAERRRRCARP